MSLSSARIASHWRSSLTKRGEPRGHANGRSPYPLDAPLVKARPRESRIVAAREAAPHDVSAATSVVDLRLEGGFQHLTALRCEHVATRTT